MIALQHHSLAYPSSIAVSLRVESVRDAAEFYQRIGFTYVMSVPDENGDWLLCLLHYGSGSILLGAVDHPHFPPTRRQRHTKAGPRGLGVRIDLTVPELAASYAACVDAGCEITAEPVQEFWGDRTFSCLDPFGYEWQFTQRAAAATFDEVVCGPTALWS